MMEVKIPFYNILNMFLTGLVFIAAFLFVLPDCRMSKEIVEFGKLIISLPEVISTVLFFAVAYEIGLVFNRMGSVILEKPLKGMKCIPMETNYVLFNKTKEKYPIMNVLSREYALSRTGMVLFFSLLVMALCAAKWVEAVAFAAVIVVFFFSCKKHSDKISELILSELEKDDEKSQNEVTV